MEYAGVSLRFVAVLIDAAVVLTVVFVVALFTGGGYSATYGGVHEVGVTAEGWWPVLLFFAYYVLSEAAFGRTIGKRLVGVRVVDEDGDPISFGQSFVRNLLRVVDVLFFYLVAAIAVWSSSRRQRLGDRVANTFVVHDRGEQLAPLNRTPASVQTPHVVGRQHVGTYSHAEFMEDLARAKRASGSSSD